MAYIKQNWVNYPDESTPITAERLMHMEDGIFEAGQSGGGAHVGTEPPTEEGMNLWINPEEMADKTDILTNTLEGNEENLAPNVRTVNEEFINIKGKILWTNPNPTIAFETQNITLNSDDYDVYEVFYYISTENLQMLSCKSIKGHGTRLMIPSTNMEYRRMNVINDTTYSFEVPSNATFGVPVKIIGYKTGLFNEEI